MKATAVAHPIQGLVKYHGLKKPKQRIPYHDSISVCIDALKTTTTVETLNRQENNDVTVNGRPLSRSDRDKVDVVLSRLKKQAHFPGSFKVVSENNLNKGKGLGFSASGFAALGMAASSALGRNLSKLSLSEIVRLGAGSSTRSLAGRFAIWYAEKEGRSYAEQLKSNQDIDFSMVIIPIESKTRTDEAHAEVLSSPLFAARLETITKLLNEMKKAIKKGDVETIGRLAEEDTLNLHAITMTGRSHMVLWEPETIRIIREVARMREEGTPAWFSIDTGPSVFINTPRRNTSAIAQRMDKLGFWNVIVSDVGDRPSLITKHLF